MAYERVGKEALYFSKEEIELLRSCIGKEVVCIAGMILHKSQGKYRGALEYLSLKFNDKTMLTISNELADMPYFLGEGDEQYMEGGNFHLSSSEPVVDESNWDSYPLTHDDLPVCPIVRRAYIINQSLAYNNAGHDNTVHSFIHTSGIILAFWDDDQDKPYGKTTYMIIRQPARNTDHIYFDISSDTDEYISASMREWDKPDLYSTSLIRVG